MAKDIESSITPVIPLSHGEKLLILVTRFKKLTGLSATEVSERAGYTRTYIPKLYNVDKFSPKQIKLVSAALNVPESAFDNDLEARVANLETEVAGLKESKKNLDYRIKILEAENSGLRQALQN